MYNPYYYQQPTYQQTQQSQSIQWVQGDAGARAYMVGAGNSVILMDSEDSVFFIKSADQSGMPMLRKFKYEEVTHGKEKTPQVVEHQMTLDEYVTKKEFEKRLAELKPRRRREEVDD